MLAGDPTEASDKAEEFLKERSLSSYYDEVALKGLQLAQADADRGALDQERLTKIRDAAIEFAGNLADQDDRPAPKVRSTSDARSDLGGGERSRRRTIRKSADCQQGKTCQLNGRANVRFYVWLGVV